jgi:hypothetical protein
LVELSETLQLILTDLPGDAAGREAARKFCIAVYASGLFQGSHCRENLQPLLREAEQLGASLDRAVRTNPYAGSIPATAFCPSYTQ